MSEIHALMLFGIAPRGAEMFRNDPHLATLSDPAVLIGG
jgi:hypothetical protein